MDSWSVGCGHELRKAKCRLLTLLRTWLHQRRERLKMCVCSVLPQFERLKEQVTEHLFWGSKPWWCKDNPWFGVVTKVCFFDVPGTGVTGDEWLSGYKRNQTESCFLGSMHVFHRSVGMCFYLLFCPRHDWSIVKFYIAWHYLRGMLGWYKCVLFLLSIICNKKALQGILPPRCGEVRQFMFLARRKFMGWFPDQC